MHGDDRTRFCEQCHLHVYNISELTRRQVEALITETEGRFCARLYRRADGTVLTKDCPVGLRAIRRRVSRMTGAAITALLSFCFAVMGQKRVQVDESCPPPVEVKIARANDGLSKDKRSALRGIVKDPNGAVVAGAIVVLINLQDLKKSITATTNDEGFYSFYPVEPGMYSMRLEASGFAAGLVKMIEIKAHEVTSVDMTMGLNTGVTVLVGAIGETPVLDHNTSSNKIIFTPKQITRLPY